MAWLPVLQHVVVRPPEVLERRIEPGFLAQLPLSGLRVRLTHLETAGHAVPVRALPGRAVQNQVVLAPADEHEHLVRQPHVRKRYSPAHIPTLGGEKTTRHPRRAYRGIAR